jgi:hypothetical protein
VPTAIEVAPVTVATDDDLAVTTSTVIETGCTFHRRLLPMRTGLMGKSDKYLSGSCSARLLGCGIGGLSRSIHPVPHSLNGSHHLPDFWLDVTLCFWLFLLNRHPQLFFPVTSVRQLCAGFDRHLQQTDIKRVIMPFRLRYCMRRCCTSSRRRLNCSRNPRSCLG